MTDPSYEEGGAVARMRFGLGMTPSAQTRATGSARTPVPPRRRKRWGALPTPALRADLLWGKRIPELVDVCPAQIVKAAMERPEYEAVMGAKLDAIDTRNRTGFGAQAGRPIAWTSRRMEAILMYRRYSGISTVKRTRERLTYDEAGRRLLGLDPLPSAPTISRYLRQHFNEGERADLLKQLEVALREAVCKLPGFEDEARILGMDGSKIDIRHTPPWAKLEPHEITAPEAGCVGRSGGPKRGQGFQLVALWTEHGTPLAWDISALSSSEYPAAERVLDRYESEVLPHRAPDSLSVLSADGGFSSAQIRRRCQELRIVPNIHRASHGDHERARLNVADLDGQAFPLDEDPLKPAYGNWTMNGHAELKCACGHGRVERDIGVKHGNLRIASVGRCSQCGNVRVSAGRWTYTQNPSAISRVMPGEDGDPFWGNPLTYHDKLAHEYGRDRFGWNESLHATLKSRFGLLKDKCWLRRRAEVEIEFAIAFCGIHALRLERQRRLDLAAAAAKAA